MILCPVDIVGCVMAECQSGYCARSPTNPYALCWDCGDIVMQRHALGSCATCLLVVEEHALSPQEAV